MDSTKFRKRLDRASASELEELCIEFFGQEDRNFHNLEIELVDDLADRQWHRYELPSYGVDSTVGAWLEDYCDYPMSSPTLILKLAYSFGLDKSFFHKVKARIPKDEIAEYHKDLEMSKGSRIDPYWSVRK